MRVDAVEIHTGNPAFRYQAIRDIEVKCEASTAFSSAPKIEEVNARLQAMAASVGANAVIRVRYDSGMSLTSWRSMTATGVAVFKESDEVVCASCAENIKRAALKCRYCGAERMPEANRQEISITGRPVVDTPIAIPRPYSKALKSSDGIPIWVWVLAGAVSLIGTIVLMGA
jgi:hypothetical protein